MSRTTQLLLRLTATAVAVAGHPTRRERLKRIIAFGDSFHVWR